MVDFGDRLKHLRQDAALTQQQLAERIGVTKSTVSYYELSERAPSPEMLIKLAGVFHVTTDQLLGVEHGGISVDVSGLDSEDVKLVRQVVAALRRKNTP